MFTTVGKNKNFCPISTKEHFNRYGEKRIVTFVLYYQSAGFSEHPVAIADPVFCVTVAEIYWFRPLRFKIKARKYSNDAGINR